MKIHSNISFPGVPQRWKDGQWIIFNNQKDNGIQPEENAGGQYEADFTIVKELTAEAAILAFTRMTQDTELERAVIDNIEVNRGDALSMPLNYTTKVSTSIFPLLPSTGRLLRGEIYSYSNGAVMVMQDHDRSIYAPELTPALFSFFRENPEGKEWIPGEQVLLNATRTYKDKTYKCIQPHQTQESWNPEVTVGTLWQVMISTNEWTVGVAYKVGNVVTYKGMAYQCLQAHTAITGWYPDVVPALWKLVA